MDSAGFMIRQLGYLGSAAVLYTQKALSKADIAALFLSRKILLEDKGKSSDCVAFQNVLGSTQHTKFDCMASDLLQVMCMYFDASPGNPHVQSIE